MKCSHFGCCCCFRWAFANACVCPCSICTTHFFYAWLTVKTQSEMSTKHHNSSEYTHKNPEKKLSLWLIASKSVYNSIAIPQWSSSNEMRIDQTSMPADRVCLCRFKLLVVFLHQFLSFFLFWKRAEK